MIREQAKEEMYQHLLSDYELTRAEAKDAFEMTIIDKIYDDFKLELESEYKRGQDNVLSRSCESCKFSKLEYECEDERYFCMHSDINFQHYPPYGFSCNKWEQK